MDTPIDIITKHLEEFNLSLKDTMVRKGIKDTGKSMDSLRIVTSGTSVSSVGSDYIEVLNRGRAPGKFAPVQNIQDWVKSKLGIVDSPELESVAYLINRKLATEGSDIFKDRTKGLEIESKANELSSKLAKDLAQNTAFLLKQRMTKLLLG